MKKLFEKRQWMMVTLVAVLGVAVYLNYYFGEEPALSVGVPAEGESVSAPEDEHLGDASFVGAKPEEAPSVNEQQSDYFEKARDSRSKAREEAVRLISETLVSPQATAEQKKTAEEQTAAIAESILQESNIESLILAKGFADCIAYIADGNCQVVVDSAQLQPKESLQILEIVMAQSAVEAKNIHITVPETENAN